DGLFTQVLGGKGANQAAAAAALGADVHFVGCVGDDAHGALVRADLAARGIDVAHLATVGEPTGVATILVDAHGENVVAGAAGAVGYWDNVAVEQPGFAAVDVVDTTGAGDAFNGTLAWALATDQASVDGRFPMFTDASLRRAVRLACAGGALATRALGARASLPSADEVYAIATA